jgi:cyclophilin family peptidyl-prolyl cis-trans isomerase|tara:strand:- start:13087 stop:13716 length:630 start_codon:yes stop_codon:yes gene_type:complete
MKNRSLLLILLITISACSPKLFKEKWTKEKAPASFKARFETTQGNFDIAAQRSLSPKAVDRLYQLIKNDFYTDIALYRVITNFVVQFGIHNDSVINNEWEKYKIPDELVLSSNDSMTISFARAGIESRTTQIFINLKDNERLDKLTYSGVAGFPVVAKITSGMETIHKFYASYGPEPAKKQAYILREGNEYLRKEFPKLDYINSAYIIK